MMPAVSRPPLKGTGSALLSLGYQRMVGQPLISTPSTSLSVPSKSASTMFGFSLSAVAASSKWGAMLLQCPHHGAQIFTKYSRSSPKITLLKVLPTSVFTAPSSFSGTGADLSSLLTSPLSTFATKAWMPSTVTASPERYLFLASCSSTTLGVSATLTPRYSAKRRKWSELAPLSTTVQSLSDSSAAAAAAKASWTSWPLPSEKRMSVSFFSLKMELTAPSPKATTSEAEARASSANNSAHVWILIIIISWINKALFNTCGQATASSIIRQHLWLAEHQE